MYFDYSSGGNFTLEKERQASFCILAAQNVSVGTDDGHGDSNIINTHAYKTSTWVYLYLYLVHANAMDLRSTYKYWQGRRKSKLFLPHLRKYNIVKNYG